MRDPLSRPYKKKGAPTCARAPELPNPVGEVLLPFLGNFFLVLLGLFLHSNFLLGSADDGRNCQPLALT